MEKNSDFVISTKKFYSSKAERPSTTVNPTKEPAIDFDSRDIAGQKVSQARNRSHRQSAKAKGRSKTGLLFKGIRITNNKSVGHKIRREQCRHTSKDNRADETSVKLERIVKCLTNEKLREILTTKHELKKRMDDLYELCRISGNPIDRAKPLTCLMNSSYFNELNSKRQTPSNDPEGPSAPPEFSEDENDVSAFSTDLSFNVGANANNDENTNDNDDHLLHNFLAKDVVEEKPDLIEIPQPTTSSNQAPTRKFFKSDRKQIVPKTITITDKIRAKLHDNGQFTLNFIENKPNRKSRRQEQANNSNKFLQEQAIVDEIIKNLNDITYDELHNSPESYDDNLIPKEEQQEDNASPSNVAGSVKDDAMEEEDPYLSYRQRIPFNTNSEELRQRQELLLEFMIANDICNEKNFQIFIAEPDKHNAEANRIVEELAKEYTDNDSTDDEQCRATIKEEGSTTNLKTQDSMPDDSTMETRTDAPSVTLESHEKNIERKLFPIFERNTSNTKGAHASPMNSSVDRSRGSSRRMLGDGNDQYQIDAGQKEYGAVECFQCGLLYTVHEPEEERFHAEYHSSVKILRFKGWQEEHIVGREHNWGYDGRVISLSEKSNARHLQRLKDILTQVVEREMDGSITPSTMSEFELPSVFKAFLAVRKMQFVGVCLVEPLQKAYKMINIAGIDYRSGEEFDVLCGISRIWVSPLHRRLGIARKLIQVVRQHTILGQQLSFDKIAFSNPTDMGKLLAENVTKTKNFLVYDPTVNRITRS